MHPMRAMLMGIVDYAGLFPPTGLGMAEAVQNFAAYAKSNEQWMLARFVAPAARLAAFQQAAEGRLPNRGTPETDAWRISALVPSIDAPDDAFYKAMDTIKQFNQHHAEPANGLAVVDVVEARAATAEIADQTADALPEELAAFLEIPHKEDPRGIIAAMAGADGVFAKIRTGGVTPDLIPTTKQVARFIDACCAAAVPFKATAGLHHPVRADHALSYETHAPRGTMHGFLNVFFAAVMLADGAIDRPGAEELLDETDPAAFSSSEQGVQWRGNRVDAERIDQARVRFAISFGSCSFTEPVEDLRALGLFPEKAAAD